MGLQSIVAILQMAVVLLVSMVSSPNATPEQKQQAILLSQSSIQIAQQFLASQNVGEATSTLPVSTGTIILSPEPKSDITKITLQTPQVNLGGNTIIVTPTSSQVVTPPAPQPAPIQPAPPAPKPEDFVNDFRDRWVTSGGADTYKFTIFINQSSKTTSTVELKSVSLLAYGIQGMGVSTTIKITAQSGEFVEKNYQLAPNPGINASINGIDEIENMNHINAGYLEFSSPVRLPQEFSIEISGKQLWYWYIISPTILIDGVEYSQKGYF